MKYRIITNGIRYHVQIEIKALFSRRIKWVNVEQCTYAGSYVCTFDTLKEAQEKIDELVKEETARKVGYHIVKEITV